MKNKKMKLLIVLLLILMLSLGYAFLSENLTLNGTSNLDGNMKWDIHFNNIVVNSNSVAINQNNNEQGAVINTNDNTRISFAVNLRNPGDFYEFTVDAVNEGTIDGVVESIVTKLDGTVVDSLPSYLNYTITYTDNSAIQSNHILRQNDFETYKVRIEYKKNISDDELPGTSQNLSFELDVNFKQAEDEVDNRVSYQVIHRYPNLDGETYIEVVENYKGDVNSVVTPNFREREGFDNPQAQQYTIVQNGTFTYTYVRKSFSFAVTDRTYLDNNSTLDGTYPYGTEITLIAAQRAGYTFKWSDDNTAYERTITLSGNLNLSLVYTPGTDITYTVVHKQQDLVGDGYTTVEEIPHSGTVDTQVTPEVNTYPGFTSPSPQTVTINGDGSTVVEYKYDRISYNLTLTNPEYITTDTYGGLYLYGTEITLTAKERDNFTFVKWTNNNSNSTITFTLEGNITIGPIYSQNTYRVDLNANGGTVNPDYVIVNRGSSIGTIPTPVYAGYYLDNWYTSLMNGIVVDSSYTPTGDTEIVAKWKVSIASATFVNDNIQIKINKTGKVELSNAEDIDEEYSFTSNDTGVVTVDSNGNLTPVSIGNTTITLTGLSSGDTKTVNVSIIANSGTHTITLNPNGGTLTSNSTIVVNDGDTIGNISDPTNSDTNLRFVGWYDDPTDGNEITSSYEPDDDMELFARWEGYICKPATSLHTETCNRSSEGCYDVGYNANNLGTTIQYGTVPTGSFALGNAYNCDVNKDGIYDPTTERFYYLGQNGDNAVLIFYSGFEGSNGPQNVNIFDYDTALTMLPTTQQWSAIKTTFDGKAGRFATKSEIESACASGSSSTIGSLDSCEFLFENSKFTSTSTGRSAYWLTKQGENYYRIYTSSREIGHVDNTSNDAVRPVIEVNIDDIDNTVDESNIATITFVTNGGSSVAPIRVAKNYSVRSLPESTKSNTTFDGWYTDNNTFNNAFTDRTVVTGDITVYAKWGTVSGVCVMDGTGYTTVNEAVAAAPSNVHKEIVLLEDVTTSLITIDADKDITLNIGSYTLANNSNRVIDNYGTLEIVGTTGMLTTNYSQSVINNTGNLTITSGNIIAAGSKQALYNNCGALFINGGYIENVSSGRAAVHSLTLTDSTNTPGTACSVQINGGTIVSKNSEAFKLEYGTLTIGNNDSVINTSSPVLQGATYAVTGTLNYNFYDGILKGMGVNSQAAVADESIINLASNTEFVYGAEVIGDNNDTYYTLSLAVTNSKFNVLLNANGGSVTPSSIDVTQNTAIGQLPTPELEDYDFVGWYSGLTDGIQITDSFVVTDNIEIFARWQRKPYYTISFDTDDGTPIDDLELTQGKAIGNLPASNKQGYSLEGWYLEPTFDTELDKYYVPTSDMTIYANWTDSTFLKVFKQIGECNFSGNGISGDRCQDYAGSKRYIDTGISLYSSTNIGKDYEIHVEIVTYNPSSTERQATFFNTKNEVTGYPGLVFRRNTNTNDIEISSRKDSSANEIIAWPYTDVQTMSIYRISGKIYYSVNGGERTYLNDINYNPIFDLTVWFGAAPKDGNGNSAQRHFTGTLKNMYIKLGTFDED